VFDSPAVGRRLVPHTAAMTCPTVASDWGAPAERSGLFFGRRGGGGRLAANHNSLAPNSKIGATACPKSDGPDSSGGGYRRRSGGVHVCGGVIHVQTVVRNISWFVSKLILRRPTVRLSALTAAGLLRTAKGSSFSNTSLLIIREGKSDRRAANRVPPSGKD
jgi:hypothetical protein